jgi:hypothetical protein
VKTFSVFLLFVFALLSLGMAVDLNAAVRPPEFHIDPTPAKSSHGPVARPAADSGSHRGQPGEDDSDEEDEEDAAATPPAAR